MAFIELGALGLVGRRGRLEFIAQLCGIRLQRIGADSEAFGFCLSRLKAPLQTVGSLICRPELLAHQRQTLILCRGTRDRRLCLLEELLLAREEGRFALVERLLAR